MNVLRRVTARSLQATWPSTSIPCTRPYATKSEEPDPQLNGYPQMPAISRQELPPNGWDDMLLRRNYGDPLHEKEELLSMWGPDIPVVPPSTALRHFLIACSGFVAFGFFTKYYLTPDPPAIRRQYPYDGLLQELGGLEANKARTASTEDVD